MGDLWNNSRDVGYETTTTTDDGAIGAASKQIVGFLLPLTLQKRLVVARGEGNDPSIVVPEPQCMSRHEQSSQGLPMRRHRQIQIGLVSGGLAGFDIMHQR